MADAILRSLHLLAAILWAGGGIYFMLIARRTHTDAARDQFLARGLHGPYMGLTSIATIGFGLAVLLMGTYDREALGGGFFLFHGALGLAVLAFLVGLFGHMPTDRKLQGLARRRLADGLDDADEARYRALLARDHRLAHVSAALVGLAMLGMVFFRAFT